MAGEGRKTIAKNHKARFNYEIVETIECGIVLEGSEVKSFRDASISFPDAFAEIRAGELFLKGLHVATYSKSAAFAPDPDRHRKLLAHKAELKRLERRVAEKGFTLVPVEFYLKGGRVKVALGVCRGKKLFDKRETIKKRENDRELAREMKERSR